MRVRKLLPEPLLPKTPLERFTNSSRFRQTRVSSMSSGLPIQMWRASSLPKTAATSSLDARYAFAKWGGIERAGCGPSSPAVIVSIGVTDAVEYAVVPESASASAAPPPTTADAMRGSLLSSSRSVTMPKKRLNCPCTVTNVPTFTSSTARADSSRTSSPRESDPPTTAPMRTGPSGSVPFVVTSPRSGGAAA